MKSARRGKPTSVVEVTNLSPHGFWILLKNRELFLPFEQFPWFKNASVAQILNVELPAPHHLYWPDLDIDLAVESIEKPHEFPLLSRALSNKAPQPTNRARRRPVPRKRSGAARG